VFKLSRHYKSRPFHIAIRIHLVFFIKQIRLAKLEIELAELKSGANLNGTSVSSTVNGGKPKIEQSVKESVKGYILALIYLCVVHD